MIGIIVLAVVLIALVYGVTLYNSLVVISENIAKSWANIDVLLKQRHDELPKLIDTCKQYMQHEQQTLEKIIQARARVADAREVQDIGALGAAESALRSGLGSLFALVESYPELKADKNFSHLQTRITGLENTIADRREFYNESVNVNNVRIAQFPDLIVARLFGFGPAELLGFDSSELEDIDIGQHFK